MKRITAILLFSLVLAGCDVAIDVGGPDGNKPVARKEYPTVNLPYALRQQNWVGREGSCVHATLVSLFRWQGRMNTANEWRRTHANGENYDDLNAELERKGIRFASTDDGDVAFLKWACDTRRGCGITVMGGKHMVALVHFDGEWAGILDNNETDKIFWLPCDTLVAEWQNSYGWAVTPVYTPAPPLP